MKDILENPIIKECFRTNSNYCHAIEVHDVYEIETIVEGILDENLKEHGIDACIEFFESIRVYSLNDENEKEIFDFDFKQHIKENYE